MKSSSAKSVYAYRAVGQDGKVVHGRLDALDRQAAAARLRAQGLFPLAVSDVDVKSRVQEILARDVIGRSGPKPSDVTALIERLALLLEASLALEAALSLLAASEGNRKMHILASGLLARLRAGSSLSDAMASEQAVFSPVVVAMVRAGEASGKLAKALSQLSAYLSRAEAIHQATLSALVYPAVLVATATGTVLLVLLVVLPELEPIFAGADAEIPTLTRAAFAMSSFVRNYWWSIIAILLISGVAIRTLLGNPRIRESLDRRLLKMPVAGLALRKAETGRFARVLGALVGGGVPLPTALTLARPVLTNLTFSQAVRQIAEALREGGGLAGPLRRYSIFPDLAAQMVQIGEATGALDTMLLRLADLLETDVQRTMDRTLALLVPALTIGLGALVAGIIASVMLAVLGMNNMVH